MRSQENKELSREGKVAKTISKRFIAGESHVNVSVTLDTKTLQRELSDFGLRIESGENVTVTPPNNKPPVPAFRLEITDLEGNGPKGSDASSQAMNNFYEALQNNLRRHRRS